MTIHKNIPEIFSKTKINLQAPRAKYEVEGMPQYHRGDLDSFFGGFTITTKGSHKYFDVMESYRSGLAPHLKFIGLVVPSENLTEAQAQRIVREVEEFLNDYGKPRLAMQTVYDVMTEASRMRHLLSLIELTKQKPKQSAVKELRNALASIATYEPVLMTRANTSSSTFTDLSKCERGTPDLIHDPQWIKESEVIFLAKEWVMTKMAEILKPCVLTPAYEQDNQVAQIACDDLLTAMHLMVWLDIANGSEWKICRRAKCMKWFDTKGKKNKFYCKSNCARLDVMRRQYQRTIKAKKRRKS